MDALPPGFEFRLYIDGPGLYLDGKVIATATPTTSSPDTRWRLCIAPNGIPRYEFLRDEGACRRYMAGWARRWEDRIRETLVEVGIGHPYGEVRSPTEPSRHPRGRSRRKSGL